jgi:hypothetical protein
MGHSFTSFREKHIRSKDYKVETWLLLVVSEIDDLTDKPEWLNQARVCWEDQGMQGVNGSIDPNLDDYLIDDDRINMFKTLCCRVYSKLEGFGETIPREFLNRLHELESPNDIREDNVTEPYLSFGRKLKSLLDGEQTEECVDA